MRATLHNITTTRTAIVILESAIKRLEACDSVDVRTVNQFNRMISMRVKDLHSMGVGRFAS